jgi:hypothetical protein
MTSENAGPYGDWQVKAGQMHDLRKCSSLMETGRSKQVKIGRIK